MQHFGIWRRSRVSNNMRSMYYGNKLYTTPRGLRAWFLDEALHQATRSAGRFHVLMCPADVLVSAFIRWPVPLWNDKTYPSCS